jgi:hypothetical protein
VSAVPQPRPARVAVRRRHVGALLAATAYGAAALALYHLVWPSLGGEAKPATEVAAAEPAGTGFAELGSSEALALRAAASRVQRSVYVVRGPGGGRGSAFVAWTVRGKISFLLTARTVVAGALEDGARTVSITQKRRSWTARIVRSDPTAGLAVLRVNRLLQRPLWQVPDGGAVASGVAAVAPAAKAAPFAAGTLAASSARFSLQPGSEAAYLGAPVVADDGRLSGIVVGVTKGGATRVASLDAVCSALRGCS